MTPPPPLALAHAHLRTFLTIFRHPAPHNLGWHDMHAMFRHLGSVDEQPNGNLKVTVNGQSLILPPPRKKDISDPEDVIKIRSFLRRTGVPAADGAKAGALWLLVLSHQAARLFRSEKSGTLPEQILPHDAGVYFRHAHHSQDFSRGREKPDPNSFFAPIALALKDAGELLIFGSGTGMSNEMDQFVTWLTQHHPALAQRIIGSLIVDERHLTDAQLLAKARNFHALPLVPESATA